MALPEVNFTKLFIDNKFVDSVKGATYTTINPATEEPICKVAEGGKEDVDLAVEAARRAFKLGSEWRTMDASHRGRLLNKGSPWRRLAGISPMRFPCGGTLPGGRTSCTETPCLSTAPSSPSLVRSRWVCAGKSPPGTTRYQWPAGSGQLPWLLAAPLFSNQPSRPP